MSADIQTGLFNDESGRCGEGCAPCQGSDSSRDAWVEQGEWVNGKRVRCRGTERLRLDLETVLIGIIPKRHVVCPQLASIGMEGAHFQSNHTTRAISQGPTNNLTHAGVGGGSEPNAMHAIRLPSRGLVAFGWGNRGYLSRTQCNVMLPLEATAMRSCIGPSEKTEQETNLGTTCARVSAQSSTWGEAPVVRLRSHCGLVGR